MYRSLMLLIVLFSMSILISGCNGARELDERSFTIAIGLDKAEEEDMIRVSYQIAIPQQEGGKSDASKSTIMITNTASTFAETRNLLKSEIALIPSLTHAKVIVIGEELARMGLEKPMSAFVRNREFRASMFVVVTKGTAQDFLEKNKPAFVTSMSKYYDQMIQTGDDTGYFLRTSIQQYYLRLKSHSGQPYMTLVAINPQTGEGQISTGKVPGGKNDGYKAGEIPRQGGNAVEFAGTAIFFGDKMVDTLSTTETRMLAIMLGEYPNGFISVEDTLVAKSFVNVNLRLGSKPKIKVVLVEGRPVIHSSILLEGEISSIGSGINYEQESYLNLLEAQINQVCQQEMMNFIQRTQKLNADVVGFGYYLRPAFRSNQEFEDYKWNEKYSQAEVNVEVKTKIRRTGLMLRTAPME